MKLPLPGMSLRQYGRYEKARTELDRARKTAEANSKVRNKPIPNGKREGHVAPDIPAQAKANRKEHEKTLQAVQPKRIRGVRAKDGLLRHLTLTLILRIELMLFQ